MRKQNAFCVYDKVPRYRTSIDLKDKCGHPKTIPSTITIGKDRTLLCQEKLRMKPNGYDRSSGYLMWRYPYGKEHCSKYVPCGTDAYKKIYKQRTATKQINNRILNDIHYSPNSRISAIRILANPSP